MKIKTSIAKTTSPTLRPHTLAGHLSGACAMRLLLLLFLFALPAVVRAQFTFILTNSAITITGYTGTNGSVVIPAILNGYPVTSIGENAFLSCPGVTNVTIPASISSLGESALTSGSLTAITVDPQNPTYSSMDGVMFSGNQTTLVEYPGGLRGSYSIPASVISIGDWAFNECSLTNVTVDTNLAIIGTGAFFYSPSLATITLDSDVTNIGSGAFGECERLTSITIPKGVTSFGGGTFFLCGSLTSVCFLGNAPSFGSLEFASDYGATVYYVQGTTGWSTTYDGLPAFLWDPLSQLVYTTTNGLITISGYIGPGGSVTIPGTINGLRVASIGGGAFSNCLRLTSVAIGNGVTNIGDGAFAWCPNLTSIKVDPQNPIYSSIDGVLFNQNQTTLFEYPPGLAGNYAVPDSVTNIASWAFHDCTSLTSVFFAGNAPTAPGDIFDGDTNLTVHAVPGTTGWSSTFDGVPVVMFPVILWPPQSQTAEIGATVDFTPDVPGIPTVTCLWFFNGTNLIWSGINGCLDLTNVDASRDGAYTLVVTNRYGSVTSTPAMLNVIPFIACRPVPAIQMSGAVGSVLSVDYVNSLTPTLNWTTLGSVSLTSTSQFYFDISESLPPQRFYRAWQSGAPGVVPSLLNLPGLVPAITLTGNVGDSLRLDYINQIGPTNAWATLGTITLTNTPQLYFDVSVIGQPTRLYRIVPVH